MFNAMLYLSEDKSQLKKWSAKERFPMDAAIKQKLGKMLYGYQEIRTILSDYFSYHKDLIGKSHKIIHKQGFDTFYIARIQGEFPFDEDKKLFIEVLKYTIGIGIILFVILEPLALALADDEVTGKLNFDFMTEPIDCDYFERFLGLKDIVSKLRESTYYKEFIEQFADREQMNMAIYTVIRDGAWDIGRLDEIEKQKHLLNTYQQYMLGILKLGIKVTNFYYMDGLEWYLTTNKSNYQSSVFDSSEFKTYECEGMRFNQKRHNVYISVVSMYDQKLFLEHNVELTEKEIMCIIELEKQADEEYARLNEIFQNLKQ